MRVGPKCTRAKSLISVCIAALAIIVVRESASAQHLHLPSPICGNCKNHDMWIVNAHRFGEEMTYTLRNCDNVGGCHSGWYSNLCYTAHSTCSWQARQVNVTEATPDALQLILAESRDWTYNPIERSLSLTCSGYTVARYVLSDELAEVAMSMTDEERIALRGIGSARSPERSVMAGGRSE